MREVTCRSILFQRCGELVRNSLIIDLSSKDSLFNKIRRFSLISASSQRIGQSKIRRGILNSERPRASIYKSHQIFLASLLRALSEKIVSGIILTCAIASNKRPDLNIHFVKVN